MWQAKIEIEPRGKQRPRLASKGRYAKAYTPKETVQWTKAFRLELQQRWAGDPVPAGVPLGVTIIAAHSRPQRLSRRKDPAGRMWKPSKPDVDNVAKIVLDSCNGVCWHDDNQVAQMLVKTLYVAMGEPACIEISVFRLEPCHAV